MDTHLPQAVRLPDRWTRLSRVGLLSFWIAALPTSAVGQAPAADPGSPPPVRWRLELGGGTSGVRDRVFNNTVYQGAALRLGLERERETPGSIRTAQFRVDAGRLANRYDYPLLLVAAEARYEVVRRLPRCVGSVSCFAGLSVGGGPGLHNFEHEDSDHVYWLTAYDLSARAAVRRDLGGSGRLTVDVGAPLVALVSRSPDSIGYNNDLPDPGYLLRRVHRELRPATLDAYRELRLGVGYGARAGRRLAPELRYELGYVSHQRPREIERLSHRLSLAARLNRGVER
jgi:hypothetical protein